MHTYVLDPEAAIPLYEQLYRALKEDILTGVIAGGEKLPSKRALADHLSVSRITVENAYHQLLAEGYLLSRPRSGYYAEVLETRSSPRPVSVGTPISAAKEFMDPETVSDPVTYPDAEVLVNGSSFAYLPEETSRYMESLFMDVRNS